MSSNGIFALSFHADYQCRHSGACCTADWDVPIELPVYRSLKEAVARDQLRVAPSAAPLPAFIVEPDLPGGAAAVLERDERGHCVFFERDSSLCIVHRDLGEPMLPATCRHFPRVAVRDRRGTFITLSHYCPTAASMLFRDVPIEIVASPSAFPEADYEGLVITDEDLPPLLSPQMVMDLDGYSAWERHMVARCADADSRPESALATLKRDAHLLRAWTPGLMTLAEAIERLPREAVDHTPRDTLASSLRLHVEVMDAVPDDQRPLRDDRGLEDSLRAHVEPVWEEFRRPMNRFLAAKAFASWTAYQGRGVRTIVRGLEAAYAVVRVEAARQCRDAGRRLDADLLREAFRGADFALNHLAVGEDLAKAWSAAES